MIPPMPPHVRVHIELAVAAWVGALERYIHHQTKQLRQHTFLFSMYVARQNG